MVVSLNSRLESNKEEEGHARRQEHVRARQEEQEPGSSRFESLISSHHSRYKGTCECKEEDINDDDE